MVLFAWVRVSKFFFFFGGGGVTYYNVFAFNKTEFLKGGPWPNDLHPLPNPQMSMWKCILVLY